MIKLTKFQIKLFFITLSLIIIIILGALYYFKAMNTQNMALNINKIVKRDKIYAYSVFNDFYYHISEYDSSKNNIAEFSKIIPLETSIGYDFTKPHPELILASKKNGEDMQLIDEHGDRVSDIIDILELFSKEYSKMLTTQNQYYFNQALKEVQKIIQNLYHFESTTLIFKSIDDYYEKEIKIPIDNLVVKPYKLKAIPKNLKSFHIVDMKKWHPNLIEWKFGESDRIYFQYLEKVKTFTLDDFMKKHDKSDTIIIKTTKVYNNKIQKFFFEIHNDENKITSYYLDNNGYMYILIFRASNPQSFKKYMIDYLRIAFGIHFIDSKNFTNKYAKKFTKINNTLKKYNYLSEQEESLDNYLKGVKLLDHFGLVKSYTLPESEPFDQKLEQYYKHFNKYPEENQIKDIENRVEQKLMIICVNERMSGWFYDGKSLKDTCNNFQCVKKLTNNYDNCKFILDNIPRIEEILH